MSGAQFTPDGRAYVDGLHPDALAIANAVSDHNGLNDTVWVNGVSETLAERLTGVFAAHDALEEIARRSGPFSTDNEEHARNCVEHMGETADAALKLARGEEVST